MKALISGGSGDIAIALADKLKELGWEVDTPNARVLDVTDFNSVHDYMFKKKYDLVVNNAGVIFPDDIKSSDTFNWIKTIQVNLIGTFQIIRQALNWCNPKIINIASTSGLKGRAGWSAYCASKAGVISLTESMVEEGLDAHCIVLGRTKTKMRKSLFPDEDQSTLREVEDVVKEIICLLK